MVRYFDQIYDDATDCGLTAAAVVPFSEVRAWTLRFCALDQPTAKFHSLAFGCVQIV